MRDATFRDDVFAGSLALVSGGTSGIGAAIGNQLARLGAHVIVTGATAQEAAAARTAADFAAESAIVLDVRDASAIAQCIAALPRFDILVNCAGIIRRGAEHDPDIFAEVIDVNLNGTMRLCAAARPRLRETRGCIVNTCSVYSFFGGPHAPAYTASKGGVAQLTKALAVAYAVDNIRVNAIAPGWIATPLTEIVRNDAQKSATILGRTPLGRWGQPADVANVVSFLCSPAAAFMTGAIVPVDGGYLVA
jgi:NAD(P)-dependent dehydrogenase (short-subunit alcohol dehydrogenase family)